MTDVDCLRLWAAKREPDLYIGGKERPYMLRWYLTPWRRVSWLKWLPAIYLHCILRSDDDRALHDHPWVNASRILRGAVIEHTIAAGGVHKRQALVAGDWKFRWARSAHRLELVGPECWTLFFTGFRLREWGFHCPEKGWVKYDDFASYIDGVTEITKGCA